MENSGTVDKCKAIIRLLNESNEQKAVEEIRKN
jgi:hypothetical protein